MKKSFFAGFYSLAVLLFAFQLHAASLACGTSVCGKNQVCCGDICGDKTLKCCGDNFYNPKTQGCCADTTYEQATEGCCGQNKYTQGSQKCCPQGVVCQGNERCLPMGEWSSDIRCEENSDSSQLQVDPKTLMTEEEKEFLFKATVAKTEKTKPEKMTLVEFNKTGEKVRYRWALMDNGLNGDAKANDGTYSRMVTLKEKNPGKLNFALEPNPNRIVSVYIGARPTFMQLLAKIWTRLQN